MWMALGLISLVVVVAALVGTIVGLIIGIVRKRWNVLKWCVVICGVAFALLIVAVAFDTSNDDSESELTSLDATSSGTSAQPAPMPTPTAVPAPTAPPSTAIPTATAIVEPQIVRENEEARKNWRESEARCDRGKMRDYNEHSVEALGSLVELKAQIAKSEDAVDANHYDDRLTEREIEVLSDFLKNGPESFSYNDWGELYDMLRRLIYTTGFLFMILMQSSEDQDATKSDIEPFLELTKNVVNQFACRTAELQQQ